jgi:hypothetical protein
MNNKIYHRDKEAQRAINEQKQDRQGSPSAAGYRYVYPAAEGDPAHPVLIFVFVVLCAPVSLW